MNIHLPSFTSYFDVNRRGTIGFDTLPYGRPYSIIYLPCYGIAMYRTTTSRTRNASTNRGSTNLKRRKSAAIGTPCSTSMSIFHHLPMKIWAKVQAKAAVDRSLHGVLRYFFLFWHSLDTGSGFLEILLNKTPHSTFFGIPCRENSPIPSLEKTFLGYPLVNVY